MPHAHKTEAVSALSERKMSKEKLKKRNLEMKSQEAVVGENLEVKKKKRRRGKGRGLSALSGMEDDLFFKTPFGKKFITIYQREHAFITSVMNRLPHTMLDETKKSDELVDVFLLDDDDGEQSKMAEKEKEFLSRWLPEEEMEKPTRTTDHEELKERLHAKISEIRQAKLDQLNPDKKKKKKKKKYNQNGDDPDGSQKNKAQFISKPNPNTPSKKLSNGGSIQGLNDTKVNGTEKTPLRKKSVVKSDGQIVYSKFDFISEDKHLTKKGNSRPSDLLKSVEKHENKISKLESLGKKTEAVSIAENQKWISAIRRAQGYKVRDDPNLLKKTIKKQDKLKKTSTKKWKERTEKIVKEKEDRQQKRLGNIQARKDDKKKKNRKFLRKKGRIA